MSERNLLESIQVVFSGSRCSGRQLVCTPAFDEWPDHRIKGTEIKSYLLTIIGNAPLVGGPWIIYLSIRVREIIIVSDNGGHLGKLH